MFGIHWRIQRKIEEYLDGTLAGKDRERLESHLERCAGCRVRLEKERQFRQELTDAGEWLDESWERSQALINELPRLNVNAESIKKVGKSISLAGYLERLRIPVRPSLQPIKWAVVFALFLVIFWGGERIYQSFQGSQIQVAQTLGDGIWKEGSGSTGLWVRMQSGDSFAAGDKLRTDEYGKAKVSLGQSGTVWVDHSSRMRIQPDSTTALYLEQGSIYIALSHHPKPFEVQTPAGVIRVYGTQFTIAVDSAQKTTVASVENTVYFANEKGQVALVPGYQSEAVPGQSPENPIKADIDQLDEWKAQFEQLVLLSMQDRKRLREDFINHGDLLYDNKNYPEALERFKMGVLLDPEDYVPYYGIGRSYQAMGNYSAATATFFRAVEIKPDASAVYYQLSQTLMDLKEYTLAERVLEKLISLHPKSHTEWVLMGNVTLMRGKLEKAESSYRRGLGFMKEECPGCLAQIHGGLSSIARIRGDLVTAQMEIEKARKYQPWTPFVFMQEAHLYKALGKPELEKKSLNNSLKLTANGAFAEEARQRLKELE